MQISLNRRNRITPMVMTALVIALFAQGMPTSIAVTLSPPKTQLSAEARTLDSFGDDLLKLDKRTAELNKRGNVLQADFDAVQNSATDLKRRLSDVQNAARAIISKLKAAGEWDALDSTVAASIDDSALRTRFNQTSLKRELEWAAAGLGNEGDQIVAPVENLRRKLSRSEQNFDNRAVITLAVAYRPEPVAVTTGLKCGLAHMRYGISKIVWGAVRAGAHEAYHCACNIPSGYSCYSPE
jgi:hypothetical protein